jgi:hypothetical protein
MINPSILNQYPSYDLYWAAYAVPKLLVSGFWLLVFLRKEAMKKTFVTQVQSVIQDIKALINS